MSLTTSPLAIAIPGYAAAVSAWCAAAWRLKLNNAVKAVIVTTDSAVTFTHYTSEAIDGDTSTVVDLSSLPAATSYVYVVLDPGEVCSYYNGLYADVVAANGNASVLSATYWNGAWTSLTITDGTIVATGKTLGQDGAITWTAVTDAIETTVDDVSGWAIRFAVSADLDSATTVCSIVPMANVTAGYMMANEAYYIPLEPSVKTLEALVDSSTATAYVSYIAADRK